MHLRLVICLVLLSLTGSEASRRRALLSGDPVEQPAGGVACSGAFASGATERFESGAGAFCTTGWTETDVDGDINTFATDQFVTGTHAYKFSYTSDHVSVIQNQVGTEAAFTMRFYVRWSGVDDSVGGETMNILTFDDGNNPASGNNLEIYFRRNASSVGMRIGSTAGPDLTENTWYRIELDMVTSGTCSMRTFSIGGAEVGTAVTATSGGACYHVFAGTDTAASTTLSQPASVWIDNIIVDPASTYPIGSDE